MKTELKSKTNYSFLRGASHPEELVAQAFALGLEALAITDHDGVYALPKAYAKVQDLLKRHPDRKFNLISGCELTIGEHAPLTLLCRHKQAYALMCRMITKAHADQLVDSPGSQPVRTLHPKGEARLEWAELLVMMTELGHDGLIALVDPNWISASGQTEFQYALLKRLFSNRLYLSLSRWLDGHDKKRTRVALEVSEEFQIPIVATNEVHYHHPKRRVLQDVLTANRHLLSLNESGRKLFSNSERYLKSPAQMGKLFEDLPQALAAADEIAQSCAFSLSELKYHYPSEWIPLGETSQSFLERLTWEGARERYPEGIPDNVTAQLNQELKLIGEVRFADYFLTVWQIVDYAKKQKILCQGRGSAANSAVCYCLGITAIDPVRMNLLFERFISVERGEPPDIDVDFEHERREEVIQHIYEKYGRHRAAMVSAVITYKSRSALRDIKRAFGCDLEEPPPEQHRPLFEKLAHEMRGFPRHLSIHSGGFILSHEPLTNIVPIEPARMEGRSIIQWDKYDLDILGLLKVDVLALGMLTALQKTLTLVKKELYEIAAEDQATYEMMQKGETVGLFQIESRAQMNMLGRLQPKTFYDLVIEVAIVRPGPIVGKMVHPYLKRRQGLEPIEYPHPLLESILGKTLGVPLFQEQVMKMSIVLAGFTPGEADRLRRAIGAWRSNGTIEEMGQKLRKGLLEKGLPRDWVQRVFDQIKGFAEYGFPESHAASFALLAYASAYLKCHHPAEFTCSLINSQPMGFYSVHTLIEDAKRSGVRVLSLDPNISEWNCAIEDGALRLGFRVARGIREAEVEDLLKQRAIKPFVNLFDFLSRVNLRRDVLVRLAMGDVFKPFGFEQRQALWEILAHQILLFDKNHEQLNLFAQSENRQERNIISADSRATNNDFSQEKAPRHEHEFERLGAFESIMTDYESFGLSLRGHPMQVLRKELQTISKLTTRQVRSLTHGSKTEASGLVIVRQKPPTAKGTVFATLEDETGLLDLIFHKATFEKYEEMLMSTAFLTAQGVVQREGWSSSLLVHKLSAPLRDRDEGQMRKRVRAYGSYFG